MEPQSDGTDGAVWRLHTNTVWYELTDEKQEPIELRDGSFTPAVPENTQSGLNGDYDIFLFYPQRIHARQVSQLAAYTVHPNRNPTADIAKMLRKGDQLTKYIIPNEIMRAAFAKLWSLGVRYESLFPDPEGAAKGAKYVIDSDDGLLWTATMDS